MTLLYLAHSCPYPPHKGDRIRSFNILKYISSRYQVKLIYPSFSDHDVQCAENLKKYCVSVETVRINTTLSKIRCFVGIFSRYPLTVWYFYSKNIQSIIDDEEFDVVLVDCSSMTPYVKDRKEPKIVDFIDVDYDKWRMYAEREKWPKALLYNMEYIRLRRFENEMNELFDSCLVVSENEKSLLRDKTHIAVMPNGIDFHFFSPREKCKSNTLVFSGAMDYFANIDGVLYFHKYILPLIKEDMRNVKFIISGMNPSKKIRQIENKDIVVTGYVRDIREYIAQASVCVVPLLIAKGIQNKILEAMAMEIPVVATTVANQGINARDKKEIMIADSPADFAKATLALLKDEKLRNKMAASAKRFIQERFSWDTNLKKIDEVVSSLIKS